jgi:caffeoyl-CoA O-methyltransferase
MAVAVMEKITTPTHPFAIVNPDIENYVSGLLQRHDEPVLLEMEAMARERNFPIVGRLVGASLEVLAACVGAQRVFEAGSGYGYSAYWFTRAAAEVVCTDGDAGNRDLAEGFLTRVGRWDRVHYHVDRAQDVLARSGGQFDVIYNDVDKGDYPEMWHLARARLRPGGLYICDNVLWGGRVLQDPVVNDVVPGWTEAIREHNRLISNDIEFDFFLNPTRDGVMVARRRS